MNSNCEHRGSDKWPKMADGSCFRLGWRSIAVTVALAAGLYPAIAAGGDDLNSRYRSQLLDDQTHLGLGTRTGFTLGGRAQTPAEKRPPDPSLLPKFGEPAGERGRDR
jgi:hypothetical protein